MNINFLDNVSYKKQPIKDICNFFFEEWIFVKSKKSLLYKTLFIIRSIFFVPLFRPTSSKPTYFFYSIDRSDYKILSEMYLESLNLSNRVDKINLNRSYRPYFSLNAFIFVFSIKSINLIQKLIIFRSLNFYDYGFSVLKKAAPRHALFFNSSFQYESIICIICRNLNVKTVSMQHALYNFSDSVKVFDHINYSNIQAEHFLSWGKFTTNQFKDISKTNFIDFGNPKYKKLDVIQNNNNRYLDNILVLLPREIYIDEIIVLLRLLISQEFNKFNFFIKLHPSCKPEQLRQRINLAANFTILEEKNLQRVFESQKYSRSIGFNTSSLIESILFNIEPVIFKCGKDEFQIKEFKSFSNKKDLLNCLSLKIIDISFLKNYFFGINIDNSSLEDLLL